MQEHLEPTPPSIFEQLFSEINRLQTLNHVSKEQLAAISQLVERAATAHFYIQGQLIKALERIAEQPDQNEDFGNAMLHLWIDADNKAEQLEARCAELEQELLHARHDNGVLLRMLATAHGEKLTGGTSH